MRQLLTLGADLCRCGGLRRSYQRSRWITALLATVLGGAGAMGGEVRIVGFNVDAGLQPNAALARIAAQLEETKGVDLWGLSEVTGEWVDRLVQAAMIGGGGAYAAVMGQKTSDDRLLVIYRTSKFRLVGKPDELTSLRFGRRGNAPLVVTLNHIASGTDLLFVVNHFHRRNSDQRRQSQAEGLRKWAARQRLPIIAVGTYNLDFNVEKAGRWDKAYESILQGDVLHWVRPDVLVPTRCSDDMRDVVDFVFVAGAAKNWPRESTILREQDEYCFAAPGSSRHRPVKLVTEIR